MKSNLQLLMQHVLKSIPQHLTNDYRQLSVGSNQIKLVIWDTAGQERYHALN